MEKRKGGNGGQKDFQKTEGKVLDSWVVSASTYVLETLALSELNQHTIQVCGNNWIRTIPGVRRVERRRMKDQWEEVETKACIVCRIVKSRMTWAGHMVRMKDDKLPKNVRDKEARRFQKTRKTTAKMGGMCDERSEKGRGRRHVERKCQQHGPMERHYESSCTSEWPVDQPHPYTRETRGRAKCLRWLHQQWSVQWLFGRGTCNSAYAPLR